jgi:hypothetical protein
MEVPSRTAAAALVFAALLQSSSGFAPSSLTGTPVAWQRAAKSSSSRAPAMVTAAAPVKSGPSVKVAQPLTLTEKILAKACDRAVVRPNDNVWVKTDVLMTHDVCGPGTIGNFYKEFGADAKVRSCSGSNKRLSLHTCLLLHRASRSLSSVQHSSCTLMLTLATQVWDKEGLVIIPDHYIFTADPRANRNVDILRDFAKQQNLKYFYDITDR